MSTRFRDPLFLRVFIRLLQLPSPAPQRDLLASWERDGHLKNLGKLRVLGPQAMHEYVKEVVQAPRVGFDSRPK